MPTCPTGEGFNLVSVPAVVLRNKGVPVTLFRVDDAGAYVLDTEGERETDTVWLQFDANKVADLEDAYDRVVFLATQARLADDGKETGLVDQQEVTYEGVYAWQASLQHRTNSTVRKTIAVLTGLSERAVGARMIPQNLGDYTASIGIAWAIATGVDPETAGKMLAVERAALKRAQELETAKATTVATEMERALEKLSQEAGFPGPDGSATGSETPTPGDSAETSESSGV